ncbi:MAG: PEGA domain-containing protein, partial [Rhodothermales bacterium]|nr:PEGA domain-containing protein [Rhodothermales bacterium]
LVLLIGAAAVLLLVLGGPPTDDQSLRPEEIAALQEMAVAPRAAPAPAAPPRPTATTLHLLTVPSGASVLLDGEPVGTTPLRLADLAHGPYDVRISHDSHAPVDTVVYVEKGAVTLVTLSLDSAGDPEGPTTEPPERAVPLPPAREPERPAPRAAAAAPESRDVPLTGVLHVRSEPAEAEVFVDGRPRGKSPLRLDSLSVGTHRVVLQLTGYQRMAVEVEVVAGQPQILSASLSPALGTLVVRARPWGSIYVDGTLRAADTDLALELSLPAGPHEVRVEHPTLGTWEETVDVEANSTARIVADLNAGVE